MKKFLIIIVFIFSINFNLYSGISDNDGTKGSAFLKIGPSARLSSLGGAVSALKGDPASINWNPAGIAYIKCPGVEATYINWFADTDFGSISAAFPLNTGYIIGAGITYLDYGTLEKTSGQDAYGLPVIESEFKANDMKFSLSLAKKMKFKERDLGLGGTLKATRLFIEDDSAAGYAFDAGAVYDIADDLQTGLCIRNIGSLGSIKEKSESTPAEIRVGLLKILRIKKKHSLQLSLDFTNYSDTGFHILNGIEYGYNETLFARLGYRGLYDTDNITAGFGVRHIKKNMAFDYAYTPFTGLGGAIRFSFSYIFCNCRKEPEKAINISAPYDLSFKRENANSGTLYWNSKSTGAEVVYSVFVSTDEQNYISNGNSKEKELLIENISPVKENFIKVRASMKEVNLAPEYSEVLKVPAYIVIPPAAPAIKGSAKSYDKILWKWDISEDDVDGYRIYDSSTNILIKAVDDSNTSGWLEEGLVEKQTYSRKIKTFNKAGESSEGESYTVRTPSIEEVKIADILNKLAFAINFKTGSSIIDNLHIDKLDSIANELKILDKYKVRIEGHSDNLGKESYNKSLSMKRADAIKEYLISKGLDGKKLKSKGYGSSFPSADNATEEGRWKNRRIEFVIISPDGVEIRPSISK